MAPDDYKTAGILMMVSGGITMISAVAWIVSLLIVCVGVAWVVPLVVGGLEVYVGLQMWQGKPQKRAALLSICGLISALCCLNLLSVLLEVLVQVWLRKPGVGEWLAEG